MSERRGNRRRSAQGKRTSGRRRSAASAKLGRRMAILYSMVRTIGSEPQLERVLDISKRDLASAVGVRAVSIKLLDEERSTLRFAAVLGLPELFDDALEVSVAQSAINRRLIDGESWVTGNVAKQELFQFGEELAAAGFKSVLFVPLKANEAVIGVVGAYCSELNRFARNDVEFLELAAGLLAVAIENARAHEAVRQLGSERARFMLQVAHNLRAPLAATASMVEVIRKLHLGSVSDLQAEYLRRIDRRIRTMAAMIDELLALSKVRVEERTNGSDCVDLELLAGRLMRTFEPQAKRKGLRFGVTIAEGLPPVSGSGALLEQVFENLISNAIKYTPEGSIDVTCAATDRCEVKVEIRDTGIGIPESDAPRLFGEFFRARNARVIEEIGTGLGLALVKEMLHRLGGRVSFTSIENRGSTFTVHLPVAPEERSRCR